MFGQITTTPVQWENQRNSSTNKEQSNSTYCSHVQHIYNNWKVFICQHMCNTTKVSCQQIWLHKYIHKTNVLVHLGQLITLIFRGITITECSFLNQWCLGVKFFSRQHQWNHFISCLKHSSKFGFSDWCFWRGQIQVQ